MDKKAVIEMLKVPAEQEQNSHKILASLIIAQACLESGYLTSELSLKGHNIFGIKTGTAWRGDVIYLPTTEYYDGVKKTVAAAFRAYPDYATSITDHSNLFLNNKSRYGNLIGELYYENACAYVYKDGYATDPDYTSKLMSIINSNKLYQYDLMVDVLGSIKQGEKSDRVRILQKLLNKHGYKLDIDGSCGPLTNDAIEDFQGKMKIQVDGHVGKITASYL